MTRRHHVRLVIMTTNSCQEYIRPKDLDDHTVMGFDPQFGFFQGLPSNDPLHVLVRVYVIKGLSKIFGSNGP